MTDDITTLAKALYDVGLHSVGPDDLDNRQIAERLLAGGHVEVRRGQDRVRVLPRGCVIYAAPIGTPPPSATDPETAGWRPIGEAVEPDWIAALRRQEAWRLRHDVTS